MPVLSEKIKSESVSFCEKDVYLETKVVQFTFFYIGLMTGLFVFRNAFFLLGVIYNFCIFFLAFRALWLSTQDFVYLSIWPFRLKFFSLCFSLIFSLSFSSIFFVRNFVALGSQFLMCVIFLKIPTEEEVKSFIKGFKIVLIINYIFAFFQLVVIKIKGINIFYYLGYYLGLYDSVSLAKIETSRITGLIWDPYVLGMFCTLGFFLFKKKVVKIFVLVLLYFTFSRAGEVGFAVAFCYWILPKVRNFLKKDYISICIVLLLIASFILLLPKILESTNFYRGFSKESSGWRRIEYITKIPEVWISDKNIFLPIFGGAPFYSGARYIYTPVDSFIRSDVYHQAAGDEEKIIYWVVESDWFSILIGRGLFGFFCYVILFFYILKMEVSRLNKSIALAIFFAGIGYYYDSAIFSSFMVYFAGSTKKIEDYL